MLRVGITGGIGSGKSVVCQVFETLGIPVFYADTAARFLMEQDPELIASVTDLFGAQAYEGGKLNRKYIGAVVFGDPAKLKALNALSHPVVIRYGETWMSHQQGPYALKEAAIFFESGSNKSMDLMIGVTAPIELRIARTMERDHINREQVLERMARQMDEAEKMKLCDYVITNDDRQPIIPQVLRIHSLLSGEF
jgi:dephospho-CoA kinase